MDLQYPAAALRRNNAPVIPDMRGISARFPAFGLIVSAGSFRAKVFEGGFRLFHTLFGSFVIPFRRLGIVLLDAHTFAIADAQIVSCAGMSLFCGFAPPFYSFGIILFDAGRNTLWFHLTHL